MFDYCEFKTYTYDVSLIYLEKHFLIDNSVHNLTQPKDTNLTKQKFAESGRLRNTLIVFCINEKTVQSRKL